MTIGDRIKKRRKELDITVPELAKLSGIAPTTLYDLERGDSHSTTKLHRVAAALKCRVLWLETGKEPIEASTFERLQAVVQDAPKPWPFTIERARFDALPDEFRGRVDGYLEGVVRAWEDGQPGRPKRRKAS